MLTFVLGFALLGQTVKMPATLETPVGRLAAVAIEHDGDDVTWIVPPALDVFREYDPDAKRIRLRLIGYVEGKYTLSAVTAKTVDGKAKLSPVAVCDITVGKPKPIPPTPDPQPDPDPKPTPTPQKVFVSIWSETAMRKPSDGPVLDSVAVRKAAGPDSFRLYDPDVEPQRWAKFKRFIEPFGLPALVIQNRDTGAVLEVSKLPKSEADALLMIEKWRAK